MSWLYHGWYASGLEDFFGLSSVVSWFFKKNGLFWTNWWLFYPWEVCLFLESVFMIRRKETWIVLLVSCFLHELCFRVRLFDEETWVWCILIMFIWFTLIVDLVNHACQCICRVFSVFLVFLYAYICVHTTLRTWIAKSELRCVCCCLLFFMWFLFC